MTNESLFSKSRFANTYWCEIRCPFSEQCRNKHHRAKCRFYCPENLKENVPTTMPQQTGKNRNTHGCCVEPGVVPVSGLLKRAGLSIEGEFAEIRRVVHANSTADNGHYCQRHRAN
jgi:hypothetical protein